MIRSLAPPADHVTTGATPKVPTSKPDTKQRIAEATLALLRQTGMDGLTMRQVAQAAELSLGNLQYHFKSKQLLLAYTAEHYFGVHDAAATALVGPGLDKGEPEAVRAFVTALLADAERISDACLVFRELWAVSTRDDAVEKQVHDYYARMSEALVELWRPCGQDNARRATALLLPYIDGYSISHRALPVGREDVAEMLTGLVCGLLETHEPG